MDIIRYVVPGYPYVHADYHAATFVTSPSSEVGLLIGNDGGLTATFDKGVTFDGNTLNIGLVSQLVQDIRLSSVDHIQVIIGLQDLGTLQSQDIVTGDFVALQPTGTFYNPSLYSQFLISRYFEFSMLK